MPEIVASFAILLQGFCECFTQPSWTSFVVLMRGWVLCSGRRTITHVIQAGGGLETKHYSSYHRFFSLGQWSLDEVSHGLVRLIEPLLGPVVLMGVDDTLTHKGGRHIWGAGMHHDPLRSTRKKAVFSFGHNWVVLSLHLSFPFAPDKTWALPVLFRLYRPRAKKRGRGRPKGERKSTGAAPAREYRTRPELALELIQLVAQWLPQVTFHLVADSAYAGQSISRHLPPNVHLYSRMCLNAALYAPAPARAPGQRGRARKRGDRWPSPQQIIRDRRYHWHQTTVHIYGKKVRIKYKTLRALWYNSAGSRLLQIVIVRDPSGRRRDDCFFSTNPQATPRQILLTIAARWPLEEAFRNTKQFLGLEDPQNRVARAVARTAPMALLAYSLTILWFARSGHTTWRLRPLPWYRHKSSPSFADMLHHLRIQSVQHYLFSDPAVSPGSKKFLQPLLCLLRTA